MHEFLTIWFFGFINWLLGAVDGIESFTIPLFELYFFKTDVFSGTTTSP